jgi:hypothetical protein
MLEGTAATPKPGEVREAPATKQFPMSDPVDDLSWLDDGADFDFENGQLVLKGKPEDTGNAPSPIPTEGEVKPSVQAEPVVATPNTEVSELKEQIKMLQQGMIAILQKNGQQPQEQEQQEVEIDWSDPSQVKAYHHNAVKAAVAEAIKPYQQGIHAAQVNNELIAVQQKYSLTQDSLKLYAPVMSKILEGVPELSIEKAYLIARDVVPTQATKPHESTLESKTQQTKPAGDLIKKIASLTSEADLGRRATTGKDPNHLPTIEEAADEAIATLIGRR